MEASQLTVPPPIRWRPARHFHVTRITAGAGVVGVAAATDGAVLAALIAGAFTLLNTGLTVWLTGRKDDKHQEHEPEENDE